MTDTSKAYADALFSLAMDSHTEDVTLEALHTVLTALTAMPDVMDLLASPSIPKEERLSVLDKAFGDLPEYVMSFLKVLCSHGQIRHLSECVKAFEELHDSARKLSTAYVSSAVALTEREKKELKDKLEKRLGRTIRLECAIDPSLLGGLVVQVDGRVIDGSLKHRLHEIKEVMNR
ncbi:MAG: ATP synthase F1 subunit delta [Aristaeellaceae bacterium]